MGLVKTGRLAAMHKYDAREEEKWFEAFVWHCVMLPYYQTEVFSALES